MMLNSIFILFGFGFIRATCVLWGQNSVGAASQPKDILPKKKCKTLRKPSAQEKYINSSDDDMPTVTETRWVLAEMIKDFDKRREKNQKSRDLSENDDFIAIRKKMVENFSRKPEPLKSRKKAQKKNRIRVVKNDECLNVNVDGRVVYKFSLDALESLNIRDRNNLERLSLLEERRASVNGCIRDFLLKRKIEQMLLSGRFSQKHWRINYLYDSECNLEDIFRVVLRFFVNPNMSSYFPYYYMMDESGIKERIEFIRNERDRRYVFESAKWIYGKLTNRTLKPVDISEFLFMHENTEPYVVFSEGESGNSSFVNLTVGFEDNGKFEIAVTPEECILAVVNWFFEISDVYESFCLD